MQQQQENRFLVDAAGLSPAALARKHQLENDPASRTDHMAYPPRDGAHRVGHHGQGDLPHERL